MTGLLAALQFLTRIPIQLDRPVPHARIVPWFPIAGALIGATVGGVVALATTVVEPPLAAALGVVVGLLVTGAFHEDGLADVADAFGGGWNRQERLEILKDSRHGTYGVAAMVSSILVRVLALAALAQPSAMLVGAIVAHVLGRTAAVGAMVVFPPAVESGLGASAARELRAGPTSLGLIAGLVISASLIGWLAVPAALAAVLAMVLVGALARAKIGGIAGDVLGAIEQVAEAAVLVILAALVERLQTWPV